MNKNMEKKKIIIIVAAQVISVGIIVMGGLKLRDLQRKNRELESRNQELSGENKTLQAENKKIRRENANLNYQLGKAVSRAKNYSLT